MTQSMAILRRYRVHLAVIAANTAFAATFVAVALTGFHAPTPHGIPVAIVAPAPVAHEIADKLGARSPGGFDLRPLDTAWRARIEIERRHVDGALLVSSRDLDLLTAEAGGTAPAQAITTAFTALAARSGRRLTVTDVVPPGREDPQALSSFFVILCVLFPSLATGIAAGHALRRAGLVSRLAMLVAVAAAAGLASAGIADGISGLGDYWALAGIVALFSLAISAPTAAVGQIRPHLAAPCVLAFLVFGIPVSGGPANLAAFVPDFLRSLHSGLPLGVAVDSIRNTVYFHANDTTGHLWVLVAYAAGGLVALCLLVTAARRRHGSSEPDASTDAIAVSASFTPGGEARVAAATGRVRAQRAVLRHYGFEMIES